MQNHERKNMQSASSAGSQHTKANGPAWLAPDYRIIAQLPPTPDEAAGKADAWAQSFMYPVLVIDGDDLLVIARTARHSGNFHDVDLATFHRIRDFRNLAVDLIPEFPRGEAR